MAACLRIAIAASALPLAACLGFSGSASLRTDASDEYAAPAKKAMVATVFEHTRTVPVDMIIGHQIRMLSSNHKNVAQAAVIDAHLPGIDNKGGTIHEPVIAQMQRSYGTTGFVQVVKTEMDTEKQAELMTKVFSLEAQDGSTLAFAKKFFSTQLTEPGMQRNMAYFTSMLQFLDLCNQAEYGVELCINTEADSFMFRKDKKGLIELASELFDNDEDVTALAPPTYCDYQRAHHRPPWAKPEKWTNSSFTKCIANSTMNRPVESPAGLVFNRQRLNALLPLTVSRKDFEHGFDHAFIAGLKRAGAVFKSMRCGHAFLINPISGTSRCKNRPLNFPQHVHAAAHSIDKEADERTKLDIVSGEYSLFDQMIVKGLEVFMERLEEGQIPLPTDNVANKCSEMCASKERIEQGMAW